MFELIKDFNVFGIPLVEDKDQESFLPDKLVMVDLEMDGVLPKENDILQIGAIKLVLVGNQYQADGPEFECFIHTDKKPEREFEKEHLQHVFDACNKSDVDYAEAKKQFKEWLGDWGGAKIYPCGDSVNTDIGFLEEKGIVDRGFYEGDKEVPGTFHYNQFELNPLKLLCRHVLGRKLTPEELGQEPGEHDAVVDCRNQTKELNFYLKTLLGDK